ncbi:MAG: RsmE family RNA methyltransferase [Anaerolineae bacterium]
MRRQFIPPDWIDVDKVSFPPEFIHQPAMLGLGTGDHLIVLDNSGWEHEVTLTKVGDDVALAKVVRKSLAAGERRTKISLYQGLVSPEGFAEILRSGTALGIVEFVPVACDRSEVPDLDTFDESMLARWREMLLNVAQESERGRLPQVRPATLFDAALERVTRRGTSLIIWDGADSQDIRAVTEDKPFSIRLLAPPPDGFTAQEVDRALQRGVIPVRPPFDPVGGTPAGLLISQAIFEQLG